MGATGRPDRVSAVMAELVRLAKRLIDRAVVDVEKEGPLDLPILFGLVEERYPDLWGSDRREEALEALILQAALKLDGRFGGSGRISNREAAFWLFNLDGGSVFEHIDKRDVDSLGSGDDADGRPYKDKYDEIHDDLVGRAGWKGPRAPSPATIGRAFTGLRRGLAEALLDMDSIISVQPANVEEQQPGRPGDSVVLAAGELDTRPLLADHFVPRPYYEGEIRRVRETSTRLLWLYGDAGTGKTRLARAANRDVVAEHLVPVLHAGDRERLQQQVTKLLTGNGTDPGEINATNLWGHFGRLLSGDQAPPVVVFDDVPADTDVFELIGSTGRSLLVFTSQHAPPQGFAGHRIGVGELEAVELQAMLRSRLPGASDAERAQLAHVVGARPLAIEHSAAFIRTTGMPVADYCAAVERQPAAALEAAGEGHGRTLTQVYRLTLQHLGSSFEALRALDLLVFSPSVMTSQVLAEAWVDGLELPAAFPGGSQVDGEYVRSASLWCGAWPGVRFIDPTRLPKIDPLAILKLQAGLRRLENLGLVRSDGGFLVMHQLTRAIFRELRAEAADGIYERIRRAVFDMVVAENWKGGDALTISRLWWAPQLGDALERALRDNDALINTPTEELVRLATLAAVAMRAYRQIGLDPQLVFESAARAVAALGIRLGYRNAHPITDEEAFIKAYQDLRTELLEYLVLYRGFDHSIDAFPNKQGSEPSPPQRWLANTVRLKYHTEWEPAHHFVDTRARKQRAAEARQATTGEPVGIGQLRASADAAVAAAGVYYDAAQWGEAIDALEHAYGCYLQIGANVECIRGAIDAARRLSRVHLRAGHLEEAGAWLRRLFAEVYRPRCASTFNGEPSPFRLRDALLDVQLAQAKVELELTQAVAAWDQPGPEFDETTIPRFVAPRFERAKHAFQVARRLRATRLLPELQLYARRLEALTGSTNWTDSLDKWFDPDTEPYRHTLLQLQLAVIATPAAVMALATSDADFRALQGSVPTEHGQMLQQIRDARDDMGNEVVRLAEQIGATHSNPYWHTRGNCAAAMLATAADADPTWARSVRDAAKQGAENIGRPDWAHKLDGFLDDNAGLWLLGY